MGLILKDLNELTPPAPLAVQSTLHKGYKDSYAEAQQIYLINRNVSDEDVVNYYKKELKETGWKMVQSEPAGDVSPWACKSKIGLYFIRNVDSYTLYLRWSWAGQENGPCKAN